MLAIGQPQAHLPFGSVLLCTAIRRETLTGFYSNSASLGLRDSSRRYNLFPITMVPHRSRFEDVTAALGGFRLLDRGMNLTIKGKLKFICAYTMALTSDMLQQQKNAGFKEKCYPAIPFLMPSLWVPTRW